MGLRDSSDLSSPVARRKDHHCCHIIWGMYTEEKEPSAQIGKCIILLRQTFIPNGNHSGGKNVQPPAFLPVVPLTLDLASHTTHSPTSTLFHHTHAHLVLPHHHSTTALLGSHSTTAAKQ
jgi:hypothetical protein